MKIRIRITGNNQILNLESALADRYVIIQENEIVPNEKSKIDLSTLLVDDDDNEIYENDTIRDAENRLFKIVYRDGAFLACPQDTSVGFPTMPLFLLQSKGRLPAKIWLQKD